MHIYDVVYFNSPNAKIYHTRVVSCAIYIIHLVHAILDVLGPHQAPAGTREAKLQLHEPLPHEPRSLSGHGGWVQHPLEQHSKVIFVVALSHHVMVMPHICITHHTSIMPCHTHPMIPNSHHAKYDNMASCHAVAAYSSSSVTVEIVE